MSVRKKVARCGEHFYPHVGPKRTYKGPKCELAKGHRGAHKITSQDGEPVEMQFIRGDPFKRNGRKFQ